uniref:Uncharacterized protein n=1 Tax=Siphoviridae sp. ctiam3 TaxID=2825624 RepID=A0A8S5P755_9CAUD|nr:MAG TPA: hypothetical protein [Siphoviridae sp. ctiam3]
MCLLMLFHRRSYAHYIREYNYLMYLLQLILF